MLLRTIGILYQLVILITELVNTPSVVIRVMMTTNLLLSLVMVQQTLHLSRWTITVTVLMYMMTEV